MNKEVKTLGYLLKHYNDSQCYEQYVPLDWLRKELKKKYEYTKLDDGDKILLKTESNAMIEQILHLLEG